MTDKKKIKLLMRNSIDKELLTNCLLEFGYEVNESFSDEWSTFSMIITDEFYARQFGSNLLLIKNHPNVIFFPVIILLPASSNSAMWIEAGYDDILRFPMRKAELNAKLKIFQRLRLEVENKYQLVFENILLGVYLANAKNRIMTANSAFASTIQYHSREQILNKNFTELGIRFQQNRNLILNTLRVSKRIFGYESYWFLKSGAKLKIRESVILLNDEEYCNCYIGTIENITPNQTDLNSSQLIFGDEKNGEG